MNSNPTLEDQLLVLREHLSKITSENQHVYIQSKLLIAAFNLYFELITADANINFISLYTRIAYANSQKLIPRCLLNPCHIVRKLIESDEIDTSKFNTFNEFLSKLLENFLIYSIEFIEKNIEIPEEIKSIFSISKLYERKSFIPIVEFLVVEINRNDKILSGLVEGELENEVQVLYDITGKNDLFTKNIELLGNVFPLPFSINLIDVDVSTEGQLVPSCVVVFPDYLLDVTSISSMFGDKHINSWLSLLDKFKGKASSPAILIGNMTNYFLDLLIKNSNLELKDLSKEIFMQDPLTWAMFTDEEVASIFMQMHKHFDNLKRVINSDFKLKNLDSGKIYLEPSFYCRDYGIQGRLDLFHIQDNRQQAEIIELKSSKIFKPNSYGLNASHYIQTLLYDLMVKSAFKQNLALTNYILYSALDQDNLRFAVPSRQMQYEIIKVRNEMIAIEYGIANSEVMLSKAFYHLRVENFPDLRGFVLQDLKTFEGVYLTLSKAERAYFDKFVGFISREQLLSKTGAHGFNTTKGLSALWLESIEEKVDRFAVLNHLKILKNDSDDLFPVIVLGRTTFTAALSNFRKGDIAVLYPHHYNRKNILHHEIFKCTILEINDAEIVIRMRHPQLNHHIFKVTSFWNLEEDKLSSSFKGMYRSIFEFAQAPKEKRDLLLGIKRPEFNNQAKEFAFEPNVTVEQQAIIRKIYETKDYLLLWGPPGTGKTSVVIKHVAGLFHKFSNDKIIYLAYTNRAVDEICAALVDVGLKSEFIRIGSRFSIGQDYLDNLLDNQVSKCNSRAQIISLLQNCKIYVGTISSLMGKPELFDIIDFEMAIIDEASQVLEPALVGLLTKFNKFVLIGDHKQLPAVVTQPNRDTIVTEQLLLDLDINNLRISFFERLYFRCINMGWTHVIEVLEQQGRMHEEIMRFPKTHFYENKLKVIPHLQRQKNKLNLKSDGSPFAKILATKRLIFVNTPIDNQMNWKVNEIEAELACKVAEFIVKIYQENDINIDQETIGIITPYKAQIAKIKSIIKVNEEITIDTVERYQGGAREVIIFSLCTNMLSQLDSLVSLSQEGVDRKLNVALTRAKEQIIILGNIDILNNIETYKNLIDSYYVVDYSEVS